VVSKEQLSSGTANLIYCRGIGVHYHALGDGGSTGSGQTAHLLDFDNAETAAAIWLKVRVGAKGGYIDTI
jgi:hypothetical protein